MKTLPTPQRLREVLDYNAETGDLRWRWRDRLEFKSNRSFAWWNARYAGFPAGSVRNGYLAISIDGVTPLAHRAAWAMVHDAWPAQDIDHVNHVRNDNRLCNLRLVERGENNRNHSISKRNKSGVVGVRRAKGRWKVEIGESARHVGTFDDFDQAVAARKEAELTRGFHPNHGTALRAVARVADRPGTQRGE